MNDVEALQQLRKPLALTRLSRAQAKVEVAKDVIAALRLGKIRATYGVYLDLQKSDVVRGELYDLRDALHSYEICRVCALGACLIAVVARDDVFLAYARDRTIIALRDEMHDRLAKIFTRAELRVIENVFEGCRNDGGPSAREVLIAIMEDIIARKGRVSFT